MAASDIMQTNVRMAAEESEAMSKEGITSLHFSVGGWHIVITHDGRYDIMEMFVPNLKPFTIGKEDSNGETLFHLTIDDSLQPLPTENLQHIRTFDTGNGDTVVDRLSDGGYQFVIRDINGNDCCLLLCDATFAHCRCHLFGGRENGRFGLNNALMLAYAFAGAYHDTLLVHASVVRHEGVAYAFTAKSGTGKSTQVSNWLSVIPNCDLMNDDNPIIRLHGDEVRLYGSPWSGKTPCYRNIHAPLGAIVRIDRATDNSVTPERGIAAFSIVLPSCSVMKWERALYSRLCDTVTAIVTHCRVFTLHCTAHPDSARVCHDIVCKV